jgi:ABC-type lipoprotein export system ATPase subunit/GNAT superfamily N-acetyltransferase
VQWKGHQKIVRLKNGKALQLPLSACVTEGEVVCADGAATYVECRHGRATLLPIYAASDAITVGSLRLEILVKEITEADEMEAYRSLTAFHYRDQPLFGRTAKLIVQAFHPNYPKTIGYVELAMPFYMSKPRNAILDRPFRVGAVQWESWNKDTARRAINVLVRIARCVIYPEFRGLGLGQKLVEHARAFAQTRWQVAGLKPQFLEISADMLKYVPFAEKAGLHFIGETEGNLDRVATDLEYLLGNRRRVKNGEIVKEQAFGIVDQQVARMDRAGHLMKRNGWTRDQLLERLRRLRQAGSLRDLSLLQDILSLPKPTYLGGLTRDSDRFVRRGVRQLKPKNGFHVGAPCVPPLSGTVTLKCLTVVHRSTVQRSRHTSAVQQAFGISPEAITHEVINDLSFSIGPGQIAMIVGPSGSGKTTLLRFLASVDPGKHRDRRVSVPRDYDAGLFKPIRSTKPLIDALEVPNVAAALQLMGLVSLSDAFVYLKRFDELSAGQQYRAMLAKLMVAGHNVWIADEFGVNLDLLAANCVAYRLNQIVRDLKVALVVATPQPEATARSLCPDVVVRLTTAWEKEVLSGAAFLNRLPKASSFRIPSLDLPEAALARLTEGTARVVAILPRRAATPTGSVLVDVRGRRLLCSADEVDLGGSATLSMELLTAAGYRSKKQLRREWKLKNGHMPTASDVRILELKRLNYLSR